MRGIELNFFKFYLTNRYQTVKILSNYKIFSNELPIKYSVPQGTVLGLLFFIIYINGPLNQNIDGNIVFC